MAAITAAMVKELRESTGAGMMECKKALTETDGDMEAAVDVLRKSGAAKVEKKAGRIAAEGITRVASEGNTAVVVEVNSETDFVAKNAVFQEFVQNVADKALKASVDKAGDGEDVCAILDMKSELEEKTIVIGEKLSLRRFEKLTGDCVASYVHGGGRIGVLVAAEGATGDNGDDVEITLDDKPYLALGADLTADQQHTVLSYMGIEAADFDKYDVVYVSNAEEHQYLDSYVPKKQIGTKALSSVLVSLADSGNGLKVSTYNINYCTAGMYKNALATAGVEDANVIVAGPFPLSGTAALVGTFEAYEKLTGKELDESVVDAAMDELVTTGDLEQSIDGDSNDVEAMIADLKGQIASGKIKTPEEMEQAIEKLADKYDLKLSDDDKQKLLGLMKKLQGLDLNWDSIKNQASAWASQLQNQLADKNIGQKIAAFFEKLFDMIRSLFQK